MARVMAIFNAKGGVGKTTTAVNLGAALALTGKRVLLIDFDPQANATSALGINSAAVQASIYHGVCGLQSAESLIQSSSIFNYHVIPAAPHLAGLLVELVNVPEREYLLRKFLHTVRHQYDYIIIDLAPSLTLLALNALMASDEVLIPVQAEYYSLEGLGQLLQTLDLIKNNLDHELKISGALLTMYNKRERLGREVAKNLREHFPYTVFATEVPRSVALAEAPSFSQPVFLYRPDSHGAAAYRALAAEVVQQEQQLREALHQGVTSKNFGNFNIQL